MTDNDADRRRRALLGCEKILSGTRPRSLRDRLSRLGGRYNLDDSPDVYGAGGPVTALEDRVAGLLGTEAALFFPTGTMAQQVALRCWAERAGNPVVASHPLHHAEVHERDALSTLTGLRTVWPTRAPRLPTPQEITDCPEPFATLLVELPLRDAGFVLPRWAELTATVAAARARGARIHLDGARLWESTFYLGHSLAEISALADSVYVSFYKTLGGISGAVLAGTAEFVAQAGAWRHRYGGMVFQQWPAALAALDGLDTELPRLSAYVAQAEIVASALSRVDGVEVHPEFPHTHQFQVHVRRPADAVNAAALRLAEEERIWVLPRCVPGATPGTSWTEFTIAAPALEWTHDEVLRAMTTLVHG